MHTISRPGTVSREGGSLTASIFLTSALATGEHKQTEIAKSLGYAGPNIISMWKKGRAPIPLNKVPALAEAIGVDPRHLMRLVLQDHYPELKAVLDAAVGCMLSRNERALIEHVRAVTGDSDPAFNEPVRKKIADAVAAAA